MQLLSIPWHDTQCYDIESACLFAEVKGRDCSCAAGVQPLAGLVNIPGLDSHEEGKVACNICSSSQWRDI